MLTTEMRNGTRTRAQALYLQKCHFHWLLYKGRTAMTSLTATVTTSVGYDRCSSIGSHLIPMAACIVVPPSASQAGLRCCLSLSESIPIVGTGNNKDYS
jgi:hypothetical protein